MAPTTPQGISDSLAAKAATTQTPQFLMIYASIVDGLSWCGDCRRAEPLIEEKFPQGDESPLTIHYAGDRDSWRRPSNPWRKFGVPALPTLYKVTPDGTWSKLVEDECYDQKKLDKFVDNA